MSEVVKGVNFPAIDDLIDWAASEDQKLRQGLPSEWDQGMWGERIRGCGTVCCIAGRHALNQPSLKILVDDEWVPYKTLEDADVEFVLDFVSLGGGDSWGDTVERWAEKDLGIDGLEDVLRGNDSIDEFVDLFYSGNTLEDLMYIRDCYAVQVGAALRWPILHEKRSSND